MLYQSETQHGCRPHRCWQPRRGLPQFHRRPRSISKSCTSLPRHLNLQRKPLRYHNCYCLVNVFFIVVIFVVVVFVFVVVVFVVVIVFVIVITNTSSPPQLLLSSLSLPSLKSLPLSTPLPITTSSSPS